MNLLFDSFWRALGYCFRPRVILMSLLPFVLIVALALGLGYCCWDTALAGVRSLLEAASFMNNLWDWLQSMGMGGFKSILAPLIVVFTVTPLIVVVSLLIVATMMMPGLTALVAEKRFAGLERKSGGSMLSSLLWSVSSTLLALAALVVSIPLWLVPPLVLVLPPLILGWLSYRVMAFDALAEHASREERREIFRRYRLHLLGIGIFSGYLGAAPSLILASGVLLAAAFVILLPLALWIYTLVFALTSLWFAHFCLAALQALREERAVDVVTASSSPNPCTTDQEQLPYRHDSDPHLPAID